MNLRAKNGAVVPIASSTAVLKDEEGKRIGGICSFRDLRELHSVPFPHGHVREFQGMLSKNSWIHEIFDLIEHDRRVRRQRADRRGKRHRERTRGEGYPPG